MALVIDPDLKTAVQPIPLGSLFDPQSGTLTLTGTGFFDFNRKQSGEILSGVNHNRDLITQLETVYVAADLVLTAAILAEAVVRADDDGALATLITNLNVEVDGNTASVTTIGAAVGDIEGNLSAAYGVTVNVDGRVAALKLLSDGTTATASILGDLIYFGPQTVFDTATETFITEVGSIRSRYGTAFGASSDLIRWDGPVAVAQNSETPTNGYLAIKTDGTIYHNAAALGWGATAAQSAAENAQVATGRNQLVDYDFRKVDAYWRTVSQSGSVTAAEGTSAGVRFRSITGSGVSVGNFVQADSYPDRTRFVCYPGQVIEASGYLAQGNCSSATIFIQFFTAANATAGFSSLVSSAVTDTVTTFDDWDRLSVIAAAPANTAYATINFRGTASSSSPTLYLTKPLMAYANSGQTTPSPWSPGMDNVPGADVTGDNVATSVVGQGALATKNTAATVLTDSVDAETAFQAYSSWVTVASVTMAFATGEKAIITADTWTTYDTDGYSTASFLVRLVRASTELRRKPGGQIFVGIGGGAHIFDEDVPGNGTFTFVLQVYATLTGGSSSGWKASNRFLSVMKIT
jgi:hypothetical protein